MERKILEGGEMRNKKKLWKMLFQSYCTFIQNYISFMICYDNLTNLKSHKLLRPGKNIHMCILFYIINFNILLSLVTQYATLRVELKLGVISFHLVLHLQTNHEIDKYFDVYPCGFSLLLICNMIWVKRGPKQRSQIIFH